YVSTICAFSMTMGEPKMGPVTARPVAKPQLRRNHREMITGQVTPWLTPDAPREMTTKKRKNPTMPVMEPRPMKPTAEMTALQKRSLGAWRRSGGRRGGGLTTRAGGWGGEWAVKRPKRSRRRVRSRGMMRTRRPGKWAAEKIVWAATRAAPRSQP